VSNVGEARTRILETFATMKARHEADAQADLEWEPNPEPFKLGHIYETEYGSGRVLWDIDLADVKLIAEAVPDA
jgi:hypothetical protein